MTKRNLWTILEDHDQEGSQTEYIARDDPKIRPLAPNGQKRFMAKHTMSMRGPRVTDIDPNTLDSKLFNASNIKRAVPGSDDPHGHTPTGMDDAVYESAPASYRTQTGAGRYAKELMSAHADSLKKAEVVPNGFHYGVAVTTKDGRVALAAKRPRGFGSRVDSVMGRLGLHTQESSQ